MFIKRNYLNKNKKINEKNLFKAYIVGVKEEVIKQNIKINSNKIKVWRPELLVKQNMYEYKEEKKNSSFHIFCFKGTIDSHAFSCIVYP